MKHHRAALCTLIYGALGILAAMLRVILYSGADEWGLLPKGQSAEWILWILTAAAAAGAVALSRGLRSGDPQGIGNAVCSALAAAAAAMLIAGSSSGPAALLWAHRMGAAAAAAGFSALAVFCAMGKKPFFGCYAAVCVFLCVHMVVCYQQWSECPQLQCYVFRLGAMLCLTLYTYHRAASCVGMTAAKNPAAAALLGIFFCLGAIPDGDTVPLYAAGAIFLAGEGFRMISKKEA